MLAVVVGGLAATGGVLRAQQTVVAASGEYTLYKVDLVTGASTVLASQGDGHGVPFNDPVSIAREANGDILFSGNENNIYRVNPATRSRTLAAGPLTGIYVINGLALEADGNIIVASFSWPSGIYRINRTTGIQTTLAGPGVGSGEPLTEYVWGVIVDRIDGNIIIAGWGLTVGNSVVGAAEILRLNPTTGVRTVASSLGKGVGTGNDLTFPAGLIQAADGSYLTINEKNSPDYIVRIDRITGDRTVVTGATRGTGPLVSAHIALSEDDYGILYMTDDNGSVLRVDPITGNRQFAYTSAHVGNGMATGILGHSPASIAGVVPTIISLTAANLSPTAATLRGNVTAPGDATVSARGFVFSDSAVNAAPTIFGTGAARVDSGNGTGAFTLALTGLAASTTYSVRAFAASASGTAYGSIQTFTTVAPGAFSGTLAAQPVTDKTTILPFAAVTLSGAAPLSVVVTLDNAAKGSFTTLAGFVSGGGGIYTYTGTSSAATTAINSLVFTPAANRVAPELTETTSFHLVVNDSVPSSVADDSTTTVVSTSVNDAPTDITLAYAGPAVLQSAPANTTVGTLSTTDVDISTHVYSLVAGTGDTNNAAVNISGATLRANTPANLVPGTQSVRIRTNDGFGGTFDKILTFTAVDNVPPAAPAGLDLATGSDTGSSNSDNITNNIAPAISGTGETGATVTLYDTNGSTVLGTTLVASGAWSLPSVALSAGTHTLTAKQTDLSANVSVASSSLSVTVDTTAPVVTSALVANTTYRAGFNYTVAGSGAPTSFAAGGLPTGLTLNAATGAITGAPTQSGTFNIALTALDAAGNTSSAATLVVTVAKVSLTVSGITAQDKPYDGSAAAALNLGSAALVGVLGGDTVTLVTAGVTGTFLDTSIGSARPVTISGLSITGSSAVNYLLIVPTATASISSGLVAVTITGLSHVYDGTTKQANVAVSPVVPYTVTYSAAAINAGSYTVSVLVNDALYTASTAATLTITKALQTLALTSSGTFPVGSATPLVGRASSGLPVTYSLLSGNAVLSAGALTMNDTGTAVVRATQAGNANYEAVTVEGTFTGTRKLAQTIAFLAPADRPGTAPSFQLLATASSGLPVSYTVVSGPGTVTNGTVTLDGTAGTLLVRASQAGDAVYGAAADVQVALAITAPPAGVFFGTVTAANSAAKSGDIAATLLPNSSRGSLIVIAPGAGLNLTLNFALNAAGAFRETLVLEVPAASSSPDEPSRAAAPVTVTVSGQVNGGQLTGTIEPMGLAFTARGLAPTGLSSRAAGYYVSSSLAAETGATYVILGTNNEVLLLSKTGQVATGGLGTMAADGSFAVQGTTATGMATIAGTLDTASTALTGTVSVPGQATTSFAGVAATTTRTDRLSNLSSRARAGTGDRTLTTGFVLGGTEARPVLLRAIGPTLAGFGISGPVANPRIRLFGSGAVLLAENDDWGTAANASAIATASARAGAFSLAGNSTDAALLTTLAPGSYTAQIFDATGTGVALAEVYDAGPEANGGYQPLRNISTRGEVGTGENILIGGFTVVGNSPKRVLIRGVGPGLAAYGVASTLADPRVRVYRGLVQVGENDNWIATATDTTVADAARGAGAFALPTGSKDAALILTLAPGAYTAQVSAADGTSTGVALVEIYELP